MNEIKTQFTTREGVYKLLTHSEYSRPNRVPFNSQGSNPVKVSFVNVNDQSGNGDRICFNVGRELYFYIYKGVRKVNSAARGAERRAARDRRRGPGSVRRVPAGLSAAVSEVRRLSAAGRPGAHQANSGAN